MDWKKACGGNILTMCIYDGRIDLLVASHPSKGEGFTQTLPSIPLTTEVRNGRKRIAPLVAADLKSITRDWQVRGLVVRWPVQKEGWVGAPCGKVLYTLEQLTESVFSSKLPTCVWNEAHAEPLHEDDWGRNPIFGKQTRNKNVHYASKEQYRVISIPVLEVWRDFCLAHWPEIYCRAVSSSSDFTRATVAESQRSVTDESRFLQGNNKNVCKHSSVSSAIRPPMDHSAISTLKYR